MLGQTYNGLGSTGSTIGTAVGTSIAMYAPATGPLMPLVAAIGGVVALASQIAGALHIGEGCGQPCIDATRVVNDIEPMMAANRDAVLNGQFSKAEGLHNFDVMWNAVRQGCGVIPGDAGKNCTGDRQRGGKWDWFSYYRDPIENVPTMGNSISNFVIPSFVDGKLFWIGAAIVVGGLVLGSSKD